MKDYKVENANFKLCEIAISYAPKKFKVSELPKASTSSDSAAYLRMAFPSIGHKEYFYVMCLNRNNKILGCSQVSAGGLAGTVMDIRIIMQTALKANACSIIVGHNHPSGNLTPSEADKDVTKRIREAGNALDIPLLDHIILTPESYYSFADEGRL